MNLAAASLRNPHLVVVATLNTARINLVNAVGEHNIAQYSLLRATGGARQGGASAQFAR